MTARLTGRLVFAHFFIISLELALLLVQYSRMEVLAFDVLPDLADIQFNFLFFSLYGSNLLGFIWVLVVIFISYVTWEIAIRIYDQEHHGYDVSWPMWATMCFFIVVNVGAMAFEFILFRMLVHDFSRTTFAGAAELFGLLMVAAHQIASFWIMKNVVRRMFIHDPAETVK